MNLLLEVEAAISFINNLGFSIKISEGSLSPQAEEIWISMATIYNREKIVVVQGLSIGNGDRQKARCLAIFESLERLYFNAYVKPDKILSLMDESKTLFEKYFNFQKSIYYKKDVASKLVSLPNFQNPILSPPKNTTGWAVGSNIESACFAAENEMIEREIFANLKNFTSSMVAIDVGFDGYALALKKIAEKNDYALRAIAVKLNENMNFTMCVMQDHAANKNFIGSTFGRDNISITIKKSLEEVLVGYYLSSITANDKIGRDEENFNTEEFNYIFKNLNIIAEDSNSFNKFDFLNSPSLLVSNFTFKVFPVQNIEYSNLFVAQALVL